MAAETSPHSTPVDTSEPRYSHVVDETRWNPVYAVITQTPIEALCGHRWIPKRKAGGEYPPCPQCEEIVALEEALR